MNAVPVVEFAIIIAFGASACFSVPLPASFIDILASIVCPILPIFTVVIRILYAFSILNLVIIIAAGAFPIFPVPSLTFLAYIITSAVDLNLPVPASIARHAA